MHIIYKTLILTLLILSSTVYAQQQKIERVSYGTDVSAFPLMNMINTTEKNKLIGDYKGKVLILDYWFTGCAPCIASWPKLMKLQKKYKNKLEIVLVNHIDKVERIKNFISDWEKKSGLQFTIPSVTEDTYLYKAIPPGGYPSVIWIDKEGIYKELTTGSKSLNENSIDRFIKPSSKDHTQSNADQKEEAYRSFDLRNPMYLNGNATGTENMLWYSTLAKFTPEIDEGIRWFRANKTDGYQFVLTWVSIKEMLQYAYSPHKFNEDYSMEGLKYPRLSLSRMKFKTKDTLRFMDNIFSRRQLQNLYNYQLISTEPCSYEQLKHKMQSDIDGYFGVEARWEKQKKKCLVLKALNPDLIKSNKIDRPKIKRGRIGENEFTTRIVNLDIDRFIAYLNNFTTYYNCPYPIVDETGFNGLIDIEFPKKFEDFKQYKAFDRYLKKKYKMRLVLEDRKIDMLIIDDAKGYKPVTRSFGPEMDAAIKENKAREAVFFAYKNEDWNKFQVNFIKYVETYLMEDPYKLADHAWELYKLRDIVSQHSLQKALTWVQHSIALDSYSFYNREACAALLYELGQKEEALAMAKKALEIVSLSTEGKRDVSDTVSYKIVNGNK